MGSDEASPARESTPIQGAEPVKVHGPGPPEATPPAVAVVTAPLSYAAPVASARLHPLTLFFAGWNSIRGFLIPAILVLVLGRGTRGAEWIPVAAAIGAAAVGWAVLRYYTFSYWITAGGVGTPGGELIIRSGVLSKTERHIPLHRVQDIRLKQGLMHRLLGVVEVNIETAGGQGAEGKLSVLSQAEAGRLRDAIFARRVALADAPAVPALSAGPEGAVASTSAPAAPASPRQTIRRVTTRELILAGLTSNQVASGFVLVIGIVGFVFEFVDPKDSQIGDAVQAVIRWWLRFGADSWPVLAAGGTLLLLFVGILISVVGSVVLFYGFELSLAGEDLHRSYGLFTRHASSLPRRRIQLLRVDEGLLRRWLGLATLRASSAGSAPAQDENAKGDDVLLPVVPRAEVVALLPIVFPDAAGHANPDWRRVSRRAIWRGTFKGSVGVLIVTTAAVVSKGPVGLLLLTGVALVYGLNVVAYRHLGYADDAGFFRTRRGWLGRSTHVVPVRNVQAVIITQNPLDRRHGVATVRVDTAGQGGAGPQVDNVHWNEATTLATGLARRAAATRYRW